MEKLLHDCLMPRNHNKLILDEDAKPTGTLSQSSKGRVEKQSKEYYAPMTDNSYTTPPRGGRDSRHYQPRHNRELSDNARTTPPRNPEFKLNDYGRVPGGATATLPLIPNLNARDGGGRSETTLVRCENLPPRQLRYVVDDARTVPPRTKFYRPSNYGSDGVLTTPLCNRNDSFRRDYGPVVPNIASNPIRPRNREPKNSDAANPITPRTDNRHQQHSDPFVTQPSSSPLFLSFQEEREQALRDYKVTIEYKHLKSHAPGGVYLIPSMDSLRNFHGIIFVRRGPFTNGIFKFHLDLPAKYNDTNMWPKITFQSKVYNPYVNESTGELDVQTAYPTWDPSRHYLVTVLTFLKKIFYSKNFADAKANPAARELAEKDPAAYKKKVEACVHESQKKVYVNEKGSTAKFTEEEVAHRVLRDLLKHHIRNENQVTKQTILAQVEKSRKV